MWEGEGVGGGDMWENEGVEGGDMWEDEGAVEIDRYTRSRLSLQEE